MKRSWSIILLLLWSTAASAQPQQYKNGIDHYNAGRFQDAVSSLSGYFERTPRDKKTDVDAYYVRGMSFYKSAAYANAIHDFNQTLSLDKKNSGYLYWLIGKCQSLLGENYKAIESYTDAFSFINDSQKQAQLLFDRARAYGHIKQNSLAEADLLRVLTLNPDHFLAQESLKDLTTPSPQPPAGTTTSESIRRIALVIGNGKYTGPVPLLKSPLNDAVAVATELKKLKFETTLLGDLSAKETRRAIQSFHRMLKQSNPANTVAVFYYAGHAVQLDGINYMVPVDVTVRTPKDIEALCVPLDAAQDVMQYAGIHSKIMIVNASHSNPFPSVTTKPVQGLAPPNPATQVFISYAATPGTVVAEGTGSTSLYTQELIKVLRLRGVSLDDAFKKQQQSVLKLSKGKQNTWTSSSLTNSVYLNQ